jgi:hypothetical protein
MRWLFKTEPTDYSFERLLAGRVPASDLRGRIVEEIPRHELGERRIVEAIVGSRAGVTLPAGEDEGARA